MPRTRIAVYHICFTSGANFYLHVSKSSVEKLRFLKFSQCTGKNQNTILPYFAHSREPTAESIYDRACRSISRAAAVELVKK